MPRPRKPTELHVLQGSAVAHPERMKAREGEPVDHRPLGPAPDTWPAPKRLCWDEIERLAPWLRFADRLAVEVAADLLHLLRIVGVSGMSGAQLGRLETMLGRLGLTPADRSKISVTPTRSAGKFAGIGLQPKPPAA